MSFKIHFYTLEDEAGQLDLISPLFCISEVDNFVALRLMLESLVAWPFEFWNEKSKC
jgi:hypothetical protein